MKLAVDFEWFPEGANVSCTTGVTRSITLQKAEERQEAEIRIFETVMDDGKKKRLCSLVKFWNKLRSHSSEVSVSEDSASVHSDTSNIYAEPRFTAPLDEQVFLEVSQSHCFKCLFVGFPTPTVTWMLDHQVVGREHGLQVTEDGVALLRVEHVEQRWNGRDVTCVLRNVAGSATSSTRVHVEGRLFSCQVRRNGLAFLTMALTTLAVSRRIHVFRF